VADVVDSLTRSRMMSGIQAKNTKPELSLRKALHSRGFRYRLHVRNLPGKPDLVFPKYNAVVQVNGCFWHGHDCHLFKWPSTRRDWWRAKIEGTRTRDAGNKKALLSLGWRQASVWECALKGRSRLETVDLVNQLALWLTSNQEELDIRGQNDSSSI